MKFSIHHKIKSIIPIVKIYILKWIYFLKTNPTIIHWDKAINQWSNNIPNITKGYLFIISIFLYTFWQILPSPLFNDPTSTVINDRNGLLLGAHISADGQWRFPELDSIPNKYARALVEFEDSRFYWHWGVDPLSFARAMFQNLKARKTLSGGSTISMQVVRSARKNKARTIKEKLIELVLSTRLEFSYSKKSILRLYASHAPYGGNVVGLEAAAWRYFGRRPKDLSWAESALLAVLPNSPALIHPGRNREALRQKRNRLLKKLFKKHIFDEQTYHLSVEEDLPLKPATFPEYAPHLLARVNAQDAPKRSNTRFTTTLDLNYQDKINTIISRHHEQLQGNGIHNAAVLVVEIETGEVLAYLGNVSLKNGSPHHNAVDVIHAPRSTGSVLKPLLYCSMLSTGEILPNSLVADIPTQIGGYAPQNYNLGFDGAVPANRALARSLNIPAVKMLQSFGVGRFQDVLTKLGMTSLKQTPDYYGLSLILGGAEGKLWDLVGIYASMARSLIHFNQKGKYNPDDYRMPNYINKIKRTEHSLEKSSILSASAIWQTFEAMVELERPDEESNWDQFSSKYRISWKTGTSFGFRDAWAIGLTPRYAVGVWVGNADGEGRPDLIGVKVAAPILFDIFNVLPSYKRWFDRPYDDMIQVQTCKKSGFLASDACSETDTTWVAKTGNRSAVCPYHRIVHLDKSGQYQVTTDCEHQANMQHVKWFVLPPAMEWYYQKRNADYKPLPPFRSDCASALSSHRSMEMIYPQNNTKLFIPIELDGSPGRVVFNLAHRKANAKVFWHIDDTFVGETQNEHKIAVKPKIGKHILTVMDESGEKVKLEFEVLK